MKSYRQFIVELLDDQDHGGGSESWISVTHQKPHPKRVDLETHTYKMVNDAERDKVVDHLERHPTQSFHKKSYGLSAERPEYGVARDRKPKAHTADEVIAHTERLRKMIANRGK